MSIKKARKLLDEFSKTTEGCGIPYFMVVPCEKFTKKELLLVLLYLVDKGTHHASITKT